jgi:hypothetical protein
MSTNSNSMIGMPGISVSVPDGDKLSNVNRGNPNGDVVDNTAGENLEKNITNPKRQSTGHSFNMYSRPSWLY